MLDRAFRYLPVLALVAILGGSAPAIPRGGDLVADPNDLAGPLVILWGLGFALVFFLALISAARTSNEGRFF